MFGERDGIAIVGGAHLRVNYLLEDTTLFGGVKIALHQANLLADRGHEVAVVSKGPSPDWFPLRTRFVRVDRFAASTMPAADVNVATFWTTIRPAAELPGQAVHYCQGFEGEYLHNRHEHPEILRAYATPIPGMALAPHLGELVKRRFGRPVRLVPPALDSEWRAPWRWWPHRVPRILVVHPFENQWKGVATALAAVAEMRRRGQPCVLVRLSQWPLTDAEREMLVPDEYHHHATPAEVARLTRGCDLHLAPSWEQEGFGLPVIEAMAAGVPVVASDISAFRYATGGAAPLVPFSDATAFADEACRVLAEPRAWRKLRRQGRAATRRFTEEATAAAAEAALTWVADGSWRRELEEAQASMPST